MCTDTRVDMRVDLCVDMRVDVRAGMRLACAARRWKALAEAVVFGVPARLYPRSKHPE